MYNAKMGPSGPSVSIKGRPQDKIGNGAPGPGAYDADPSAVKAKNPGAAFSKAGNAESGIDGRDFGNSNLGSGVSHGFGKSNGKGGTDLHPGPGHYYVPVHFADVPRYVLPEQNETYKWV